MVPDIMGHGSTHSVIQHSSQEVTSFASPSASRLHCWPRRHTHPGPWHLTCLATNLRTSPAGVVYTAGAWLCPTQSYRIILMHAHPTRAAQLYIPAVPSCTNIILWWIRASTHPWMGQIIIHSQSNQQRTTLYSLAPRGDTAGPPRSGADGCKVMFETFIHICHCQPDQPGSVAQTFILRWSDSHWDCSGACNHERVNRAILLMPKACSMMLKYSGLERCGIIAKVSAF